MNEPIYYTFIQQKVNYTSVNEDIYSYSFVLNPVEFDDVHGMGKYLETIEIIQESKHEYLEHTNCLTQIVCLKSVFNINLII